MATCNFGGFYCSRNLLILLNVVYVIISFILIGVAAYAKARAFITDIAVVGGIIACGVFLLAISLIGIVATLLHHQVALFFYMIILGLLFITQFSIACACLALSPGQQETMFKVAWSDTGFQLKATMQRRFDCCGLSNETRNFVDTDNGQTLNDGYGHPPCNITDTCCSVNSTSYCCTGEQYDNSTSNACVVSCKTCWEVIKEDVEKGIKVTGGVGLFFSFTELMGVWLAFRFRNQKDPFADPNSFL